MTQFHPADFPCGQGESVLPAPRPGHFIHDRWQILQLVKDTARGLGLGEREISVLSAHLSVLPKGPIRSDQLLISFAQVGGILERANCMDERRFRRGETRLAEAGLITRKLSGNARRFPIRDGRGQIVDAYGIDLRPLFLRVPELEAMRARLMQEAAERRAIRSRISAAISGLKRHALAKAIALPEDIDSTLQTLQKLCRRTQAAMIELLSAEKTLNQILSAYETMIPEQAVTDSPAADAGHSVRHIESKQKDYKKIAQAESVTDLWETCPKMAVYFPEPPRGHEQLVRYVMDILAYMGFGKSQSLDILGKVPLRTLLRLLEYLISKLREIDNPRPYLNALLRKLENGEKVVGVRI